MTKLLFLIFFSSLTFAQNTGTIKGKVIDYDYGEPLNGANVVIIGTKFGAAADPNGEFIIKNLVPNSYSIKVSYIGYKTITLNDIILNADSTTYILFELQDEPILGGKKYETGTEEPDYADYLMIDWTYSIDRLYNDITYKLNSVSLWADFNYITDDGFIPLYIINDTEAYISIAKQDNDIYAKQQYLDNEFNWKRSQSHIFSSCGNSYFTKRTIDPKSFMIFKAWYPKDGEKRTVRYKIYSNEISYSKRNQFSINGPLILESNSGVGYVIEEEIKKSKYDGLEDRFRNMNFYYKVIKNEIEVPEKLRSGLIYVGLSKFAEELPYKEFLEFIEQFIDAPAPIIRSGIVGLLGKYGSYSDEKTIEYLKELSEDSVRTISDYAKKELRKLEYKEKRKNMKKR